MFAAPFHFELALQYGYFSYQGTFRGEASPRKLPPKHIHTHHPIVDDTHLQKTQLNVPAQSPFGFEPRILQSLLFFFTNSGSNFGLF